MLCCNIRLSETRIFLIIRCNIRLLETRILLIIYKSLYYFCDHRDLDPCYNSISCFTFVITEDLTLFWLHSLLILITLVTRVMVGFVAMSMTMNVGLSFSAYYRIIPIRGLILHADEAVLDLICRPLIFLLLYIYNSLGLRILLS